MLRRLSATRKASAATFASARHSRGSAEAAQGKRQGRHPREPLGLRDEGTRRGPGLRVPAPERRVRRGGGRRDSLGGRPYAGIYESHPYALATISRAAGTSPTPRRTPSSTCRRRGRTTVAAVLPAQKVTVTEGLADEIDLPDCTIGEKYAFEPVPTDVEVVPATGRLIVSLLPGGPRTRVSAPVARSTRSIRRTHTADGLASGFRGATNVALGGDDRIFVAELFGDRSRCCGTVGSDRGRGAGADPAGVEYGRGRLYVSDDVFGNGPSRSRGAWLRPDRRRWASAGRRPRRPTAGLRRR